jgi:hypothetical protein
MAKFYKEDGNICIQFNLLQFNLAALSVRLQGSSSSSGSGRVEVFHKGQWGTICDDSWSMNDAKVACRQLGYLYAVRTLSGSQVPDGTGPIWLSNVGCTGSERSLSDCYHSGWGVHYCSHYEDAGVECSSIGIH